MMKTNLTDVEKTAENFCNDVEAIKKELKRVQSIKCRLKKQRGKKTFEEEMTEVIKYEQILKDAKQLLEPKEKAVTRFEQDDVDKLDYDETIKAIRSIQSKKTLTRWLNDVEGNNDDFRNACKIEKMLIEHRNKIKPVANDYIRKSDLQTILDTIESSGSLSQERIVEMLKSLL